MKKKLTLIAIACSLTAAAVDFSEYRGVWASDSAEAVVTDSAAIFFENTPAGLIAYLDVPSRSIHSRTVFTDSVFVSSETAPIEMSIDKGKLTIGGNTLRKVESLETRAPYEAPTTTSPREIGPRLQEWRLGASFGREGDVTYCEINTNRHMFVYMLNPSMTYIRAAATRNNDRGTLFFQNIRMMANNNTGEVTSQMMDGNNSIARDDLQIDNSKFQPDRCTFCPDGGIYWSLISFTPDQILLNGCGETYRVDRLTPKNEYFHYTPYNPDTTPLPD
ncbi:MAG: hypothetical protein NC210_07365 [[Clostridium] fimetarium]|nr:hypothetical protein [Alistipes timonensis]MCM1406224.1 hypothetical protein [[Clostridium] fimetarium]